MADSVNAFEILLINSGLMKMLLMSYDYESDVTGSGVRPVCA